MKPAIRVENLSKVYHIGEGSRLTGGYKTLRESLTDLASLPFRKVQNLFSKKAEEEKAPRFHQALNDVSFEVKPGEVMGLIGRNGAGKSTLLKVISRITEPTKGRIQLRGRVASLLEIGTGFHQELTGRENIYLNGAILGMTRKEIDQKFDEIVAFAEVEKFLDTPTKRYSSGMYTRLGFAVMAHLDPEILLVDEVLAVGDISFQKKCLQRIRELAQSGSTVIFVSHSMGTVAWLCETALVLDSGQLISQGEAKEQIRLYMNRLNEKLATNVESRTDRGGSGEAKITDVCFLNDERQPVEYGMNGEPLTIRVSYKGQKPLSSAEMHIWVSTEQGQPVCELSSRFSGDVLDNLTAEGTLECVIPEITLSKGTYLLSIALVDGLDELDNVQAAASLDIEAGDFFGSGRTPRPEDGPLLVRHRWQHKEQEAMA